METAGLSNGLGTGLALIDGAVIVLLLAAVTWGGHRLSGNIKDRNGFFQAGGSLPWWAVAASIVATLVSSVTFVSVPAAVFKAGGNLTYLQVILGLAFGKMLIALLVARPFYLSRGIHTSYEYIGARMDARTGEFSMLLGLVLNVINSGVKLLTASLVLDVITGWGIAGSAAVVVSFGVLWSALSGLKTVIWTDLLLFVLFSAGALFALAFMVFQLDASVSDTLRSLDAQAKLVLFDFSTDLSVSYSIWAGVFGALCLTLAQACTQGTWQRVRACRSASDATKAYCWSAAFYATHLVILGVGLALVAFYGERGLPNEIATQLPASPDRIFPYFIVTEIPPGISGLFIAAIFAAAISTLDSALAESADLSVRHIYERAWPNRSERHYLVAARALVVFWGLVFFGVTLFFARYQAQGLLDLTFKLPNYLTGMIFATIILARFGIGSFSSFVPGTLLSCACVLVLQQQGVAFFYWCPAGGAVMLATVWLLDRSSPEMDGIVVK